jgi:hypothetical protein
MGDFRESHDSSEMSRREFLQLMVMTSAAAIASQGGVAFAEHPGAPSHAAFSPVLPGAIAVSGWLELYLRKQADELGSKLPQVSWPFTAAYWSGEEEAPKLWWPWEQKAYWVDGATRLALVLGDKELLAQTQAVMEYTLRHADADGYLGPQKLKGLKDGYGRWPHEVLFRGVSAYADGKGDPELVAAIQRHYLNDRVNYGAAPRNVTNVESILWCYERTGDPRLLALAEKAWADYARDAAGALHGDLSPDKVYFDTAVNAHGVDYIEAAKQPAILYLYTGKQEYLKFALAAQRRIFDHHMLIDGVPSTSEWYRTTTALDSHETCDIADHAWAWGYLLMATGDAIWADRIERACFNAGFGAIKKDWKGLQYFSCPNQVLATMTSNHNFPGLTECGGSGMAYQPNPGERTACCGGNVHRIFPNYALRMWMNDSHGGIAAMLYGASSVKVKVGAERHEVEIAQETDYPFSEDIRFTIRTAKPVAFPLSLRIPAWCDAPRLQINAEAAAIKTHMGFTVIQRTFDDGDTVTLTLPMKLAMSRWPQRGISVEHGPLVYSLGIQEKWSTVIHPQYSTAEFPGWEANPVSAWNYGMALTPARLETQVKFARRPMTKDPWVDPPVSLTVPLKRIEDWTLYTSAEKPALQFTPPLPVPGASKVSDVVEEMVLVPYGATHLRVTIFPELDAV